MAISGPGQAYIAASNALDSLDASMYALLVSTWPPGTDVYAKVYVPPLNPGSRTKNANPGVQYESFNRFLGPLATPAEAAQMNAYLMQRPALVTAVNNAYSNYNAAQNVGPDQIAIGIVAAGVAAGAAEAALGGTTATGAAGAGAGAGAATTAPVIAPVGVGAAVATTAGAVSTPIVIGAGTTAAAGVAAAATTTATSAGSLVSQGVTALTGSSTVGSLVGGVVSDISTLVTDIESYLKPVTDLITGTLNDIETFNKDYIVPITTTISQDYNTISGLVKEIDTLSSAGIQGILAIPQALSTAFTSLDASNQRLANTIGGINTGIVQNQLVPGITAAFSGPVTDFSGVFAKTLTLPTFNITNFQQIKLDEPLDNTILTAALPNLATKAGQVGGFIGGILQGIAATIQDFLTLAGATEAIVEQAAQLGRMALPIRALEPDVAVNAALRGFISESDAQAEVLKSGLDPVRYQVLKDLETWLPGVDEALRLFYRGSITFDQVTRALQAQALTTDDISAVSDAFLSPISPTEMLASAGRRASLEAGFLTGSLSQTAPQALKDLYPPRFQVEAQGDLDWFMHWNLQPMSWWLTGWFRGIVSDEELQLAAQANNIPPELFSNLAAIEADTIQLWMIPDMLAQGVFTDAEALSYLHYIGIGDRDAQIIVQYGHTKANAGAAQDALGLAQVSLGAAAEMYNTGLLNDGEYTDILTAHKLTPQAAALTVQLTQHKAQLAARRSFAETLVKQVDLGQISLQDMKSTLGGQGYTETEVNNYTNEAEKAALVKAKNPTEAQVKEFLTAGILTVQTAYDALVVGGWSDVWAKAFLTLWGQDVSTITTG